MSFINEVVESVTEGGSVWEGVGLGRLIVGVAVCDFSIWGLSGVWEEGISLVGGSICVSVRRGTGKCFDLVGGIRQVRDTTLALVLAI